MSKKDKGDKKGKAKKKAALDERIGDLGPVMIHAARAMRTRLSRNLAESGLYAGQDGVIQALAEEEGLTTGALAQRLGVKAPTMTRTIGRLEAQGFVERRADPKDARLTKVHLTPAGTDTLSKIERATQECSLQAVQGLSGKDVKLLVRLLQSVEDNLQQQSE
ncbi:MarR family transcriptional regulator [Ciceribacter sp. L1K23]|uniref:MarR family winged helix-turn-helix transcriptional regulator n=1 Tax=unclassified Ciceribacter TaxID=2628820 RepID=UPI001ABDB06F|nr:MULTISPECIES: MarR family transcriptional regulator [unclassified Ciceribacter]MBO3762035.1 MarR family transcriptional regulator [Ciceribacter sp. L1K22]MBR0558117.1 MarR family transcriptional regulator [Ciceribacter sp. L1K23]